MTENPVSREFFEAKYEHEADPWNFAASTYELDRYEETIRALADRRFNRAFEPGCSVGVLTQRLAQVCNEVVAIDISATAVARARERCRDLAGVTIHQGALPEAIPEGTFDLLVLSEIGYYFERAALAQIARTLLGRLTDDGVLLAVHWLGFSPDHIPSGDAVHEVFENVVGSGPSHSERHEGFRLDLWRRSWDRRAGKLRC